MKTQRTFTLTVDTVERMRRLVEEEHVAPSQDALVERALSDFFMTLRHARDARIFAEAARDPELQAEIALLAREFAAADREAWPD